MRIPTEISACKFLRVNYLKTAAALVYAITLCGLPASAEAQTQTQSGNDTERALALLAKAQALIVPESSTTPPYHFTGKIELFDPAGAPSGEATIELYWDGKSRSSHILTLNHVTQTVIFDRSVSCSPESIHAPFAMRRLIEQFLHPLPMADSASTDTFKIKPANLSGIPSDCIVLRGKAIADTPVGPPNVFCLSTQNQTIRYTAFPPNLSILFNNLEAFGPKIFAHDLAFAEGETIRAKLHFDAFAPWTPDDAVFKPAANAIHNLTFSGDSLARNDVIPGKILDKPNPVYPAMARNSHTSGTVTIGAIISLTGAVTDPEVVSSTDPIFNQAALDALRNWRYSPYLLNGQPVEVETNIKVTFFLR